VKTPPYAAAGVTAIVFGLLMFVPLLVLGQAIDWPASLDLPARELMPTITENAGAVKFGYSAYLVYSLLFFPAIVLLGQVAGASALVRAAATLAAISAFARAIGILRWLTVQPSLAAQWETSPDPAIAIVFDAVSSYGGAIGELLGVSLFAAAAVALVSLALWKSQALPRWIAGLGFVVAFAMLLPWLEVLGYDLGPVISVSVALLQLWFLTLGILTLRAARRGLAVATA
jgi:hypothetical protein